MLRAGAVKGLSNIILYGHDFVRSVNQNGYIRATSDRQRHIYIYNRRFCFVEMYVNVDLVKLFVQRSEFNSS